MLKKISKLTKCLFVGAMWTSAFLYIARLLMICIWKFDIFYAKQWSVVKGFWNNNGVIEGAADYTFFLVAAYCSNMDGRLGKTLSS